MDSTAPVSEPCRRLVEQLRDPQRRLDTLSPPHAAEDGSTLSDHLLTTSALVACLAHADPQRNLLRLAALTHDLSLEDWHKLLLPEDREAVTALETQTRPWRELLQQHGAALDRGEIPDLSGLEDASRTLALAHLVASNRLRIVRAAEFAQHPLATAGSVDVVYGGAVKIKGYVFESVKLPEIRGASALLDHINRLDLPAFWSVQPLPSQDTALYRKQIERYDSARNWLTQQIAIDPLDAPECLLYASGGNILALAPAGHGLRLAQAIEQRYTAETQVAQSVAVAHTCSLLDLQYGLNARAFWLDQVEAQQLFSSGDPVAQLFRQTFGIGQITVDSPPNALQDARDTFCQRKGFGEIVTFLTTKATRRRMADSVADELIEGKPRSVPFMEYVGTTRRCSSCDVRPASEPLPDLGDGRRETFCEPCLCKRKVGTQAKKGDPQPGEQRDPTYAWIKPWGTWLQEEQQNLEGQPKITVKATSHDLAGISQYSRRFVGLIYADGNSVGEKVARLTSISAYRQFAQRMVRANETAVARALTRFIRPDKDVWPFEIITIGGDDVLLFVPADQALEIAAAIAASFEQDMYEPDADRQVTLSAGVLLMPDSTPIRFARDLVEQLLESAKQRSKREGVGSTIDFMALKAATMITNRVESYRSVALQRGRRHEHAETPSSTLRLTQRPYTLKQLQQFLVACRALKTAHFPRSQLYQLREIAEQGDILRAAVDYRYFVERGKQRERTERGSYTTFDEQIQQLCDHQPWIPCRREPNAGKNSSVHQYDTPLLDLIEIFPFVAGREEQGGPA